MIGQARPMPALLNKMSTDKREPSEECVRNFKRIVRLGQPAIPCVRVGCDVLTNATLLLNDVLQGQKGHEMVRTGPN